jgi:SAM-dependent methyltransferase
LRRPADIRRLAKRAWLSAGDGVECPCCGRSFREFLPGPQNRPNVACPACGAYDRHRLLWLYLTRERPELVTGEPRRLLHFAPEPVLRKLLDASPELQYVSADIDSPHADHAVDIQALPFEDESFDAVLCLHVLEHVEDDRRAMRELRRILRPGGWAIAMVPVQAGLATTREDPTADTPEKRLAAHGQADHLRLYGLDFPDRLRDAGFEVEVEDYVARLGEEERSRFALGGERIYLCTPHA